MSIGPTRLSLLLTAALVPGVLSQAAPALQADAPQVVVPQAVAPETVAPEAVAASQPISAPQPVAASQPDTTPQDVPSPSGPAEPRLRAPLPDRTDPLPEELEGVGLTERRNEQLPLDLEFINADGQRVVLGDYFDGRRPVILTLNYFRCPMLCGLQLNGLLNGLREMDWEAGDKFQILTISFDPLEDHVLAYQKRQTYLREYGRSGARWQFLTGRSKSIEAVLAATGYQVRWDVKRKEWMHPSAIIICTPDGRISRYLVGLEYVPQTLKLSLLEAADGKIGTAAERFLLYCFHYDAAAGKYSLAAMNLLRAGGAVTALLLGIFVWRLWRRDRRMTAAARSTPADSANLA